MSGQLISRQDRPRETAPIRAAKKRPCDGTRESSDCAFEKLATAKASPLIVAVDLDVTINPASAEWLNQALDDAKHDGASLVILRLDTPGGLDDSMRKIIKDILGAPMPVVVYVSPNGARAA